MQPLMVRDAKNSAKTKAKSTRKCPAKKGASLKKSVFQMPRDIIQKERMPQ